MRQLRIALSVLCMLGAGVTQAVFQLPAVASPQTFTDTTTTDFDAGNTADSAAVADSGDGSVQMAPGSANFNGSALPDGWTFSGSGSASVSGGQLHVDGGYVTSHVAVRPGDVFTFRANFNGPDQWVEFGTNGATGSFTGWGTGINSSGQVAFRSSIGSGAGNAGTLRTYLNSFHTFQMLWGGQTDTINLVDDPAHP